MNLVELVLAVHEHLERSDIEHAFGGALALAYYAEPRGTLDVDVNVFVPFADAAHVVTAFELLGLRPALAPENWLPVAGVRLDREGEALAIDLFFSLDDSYDEIRRRARPFPFGADRVSLPFLSPEDLAVFKLSFGRDKDWTDLRQMLETTPELDLGYVERKLLALRGPTMYPRIARLRALAR